MLTTKNGTALAALSVLVGLAACGKDTSRDDGFGNNDPGPGPGPGSDDGGDGGGDDGGTGGDDGDDGGDGGTGDDGAGDDGDVRFDVGTLVDAPDGPPGDGEEGCKKIDFLFVVDNSGSMADEQMNLANSFPGFINAIRNTVMAQDYRILVIDTDAGGGGGCTIGCSPAPSCCTQNCALNPGCVCNGMPCTPVGTGCDIELGAGKTQDQNGTDCGIAGGVRYMTDTQPNLDTTFSCVALVGSGGDGNERPMEAMVTSVTTENQPGECNEAFVRDDAILVVTFITDEEDNGKSMGTPASWKTDLVNVKLGDENAVVMLGLIGDTDVAGGVCAMGGDAEASPILRGFAESWNFGSWGSVCELDYAPFFEAAVSVVDTACDDYVPPG